MPMERNERELPYLDQPLLNAIFAGVYSGDTTGIAETQLKDFLNTLYAMQAYNYQYRFETCATLFPLFEETVGPMERNSEGATMWLALGLALKDQTNSVYPQGDGIPNRLT